MTPLRCNFSEIPLLHKVRQQPVSRMEEHEKNTWPSGGPKRTGIRNSVVEGKTSCGSEVSRLEKRHAVILLVSCQFCLRKPAHLQNRGVLSQKLHKVIVRNLGSFEKTWFTLAFSIKTEGLEDLWDCPEYWERGIELERLGKGVGERWRAELYRLFSVNRFVSGLACREGSG